MQQELTKVARIMSQKYNVQVACKGDQAYTNGNLIVIPALPENLTDENKTIVRGYLDHEKGHVTRTDFDALKRARLDATTFKVWNYIEDIWTEAADSREYPGTKQNLNALAESVVKGEAQEHPLMMLFVEGRRQIGGYTLSGPDYDEQVKHHFGADVIGQIARVKSTKEAIKLARKLVESYDNTMPELPDNGMPGEDEQSEQSGPEGNESSEGKGKGEQEDQTGKVAEESEGKGASKGDDAECESDDQGWGDDSMGAGAGDKSDPDADESDGDRVGGEAGDTNDAKPEGDGSESGKGEGRKSSEQAGDPESADAEPLAEQGEEELGKHTVKEGRVSAPMAPELDEAPQDPINVVKEYLNKLHEEGMSSDEYMVYDTSKDVVKVAAEADNLITFEQLKESLGSLNVMRGRIAQLFMAKTASRWTNDREEGKINSRALATVSTGNRRVFREKLMSKDRDTAVTFLVDHSGSMQYGPLEQAMKAVVAFLETLEGTKIKTEVLAYTTAYPVDRRASSWEQQRQMQEFYQIPNRDQYGRIEGTLHVIVKGFEEPYGRKVKARISNYELEDCNNNCDGDSVRWAYDRLRLRPEKRKVLFALTDGMVCNNGNEEQGMAYLKKVCDTIEADPSVELICLAINEQGAKQYYKNCIDLDNAESLPDTLMKELKKLLKV